jgi:hypothetical protein
MHKSVNAYDRWIVRELFAVQGEFASARGLLRFTSSGLTFANTTDILGSLRSWLSGPRLVFRGATL